MQFPFLIRHLIAVAVLPFTVTVVIPLWLARRNATMLRSPETMIGALTQIAGLLVGATGLLLFAASLKRFATEGKGTLAPWDPPRQLVVRGPYRYVRNPMISGVVFILLAESMILLSRPHLLWALTFLALNAIFIPLIEEPQLQRRFGDAYTEYCHHVPRLLPRLKPWRDTPGVRS